MYKALLTSAMALVLAGPAFAQAVPSGSGANMIVNPWMEIDQDKEGASITATASAAGTYTHRVLTDGWDATAATTASSLTLVMQNAAAAPNGSLDDAKFTVGTGSATHADGTVLALEQRIEPQRLQALQYGTANAQGSYLQYCVKASIAGLYSYAIVGGASATLAALHTVGSSYFHQFNVPVAGQWMCETDYIPGDTGGTWLTTSSTNVVDTTHGATIAFVMGLNGVTTDKYGVPTATAADGVWQNGAQNVIGVNTTNVAMDKTSSSTFEITGVKWALDSAPLIHAPALELIDAQRYYQKSFVVGYGGNTGVAPAQQANSGSVVGALQGQVPVVAAANGSRLVYQAPVRMRTTIASAQVTTFDAQAADSKCFDITGGATQSTATFDAQSASSDAVMNIGCASSGVATAGNLQGVHFKIDQRL